MEATDVPPIVSDAGPLIHLHELECLDLLADMGKTLVPSEAWAEAVRHRGTLATAHLAGLSVVDVSGEPSARLVALGTALGLGAGEMAALTLMDRIAARMLLCDDAAARLAAESLGFTVRGTIGILVRSVRAGLRSRPQVLDLLRSIPSKSTLHLSRRLLDSVIREIEGAPG